MHDVVGQVSDLRRQVKYVKQALVDMTAQANYWYKLWLGMGTQYARSQDVMAKEIDRLRRKAGEWNGSQFLDGKIQKKFREEWVEPTKHPANQTVESVTTDTIRVPPPHPKNVVDDLRKRPSNDEEAGVARSTVSAADQGSDG